MEDSVHLDTLERVDVELEAKFIRLRRKPARDEAVSSLTRGTALHRVVSIRTEETC